MQKKRKDAKWSFKDHGFVYDVENGRKNYLSIYDIWKQMAKRTTDTKTQAKQPTYKDTWVCEEWKLFSNFLNWYLANGHRKGLCLDKDIVDIGNKCYSPDACVFVSKAVNNLLTHKQSTNSNLPIGVVYQEFNGRGYKQGKPYQVIFSINGKKKYIGRYFTPEEAGLAYGREKSKVIIDKANNLTEADCSLVHFDKVRGALINHAKSLVEYTQSMYA
jgi:hypothetical protein